MVNKKSIFLVGYTDGLEIRGLAMTEWRTYRETVRSKGVLALELYAVQSTPVVDKDRLREVLPRHPAYRASME